jgi:hypothetical protein
VAGTADMTANVHAGSGHAVSGFHSTVIAAVGAAVLLYARAWVSGS